MTVELSEHRFTFPGVSTEAGSQARVLARWAAMSLEATRRGPQEPLSALRALRHARDNIDEAICCWTDAARADGVSWARIGRELEVTGQAVRQAAVRRAAHQEVRQEFAQWRLPLPIRLPRIAWRLSRRRSPAA